LVTTRNPTLVTASGTPVKVDRMSEGQAKAVLSAGLPPFAPRIAAALIAETGSWPLLLRLLNKILADRARLQPDISAAAVDLLDRLRRRGALHVDQLTGAASQQLDVSNPDQRRMAVRATIQASIGLLEPGQYDRFAELAVFAEDETIPVWLAARLWQATSGLDLAAASALCARLADLALVTLVPSSGGGTADYWSGRIAQRGGHVGESSSDPLNAREPGSINRGASGSGAAKFPRNSLFGRRSGFRLQGVFCALGSDVLRRGADSRDSAHATASPQR